MKIYNNNNNNNHNNRIIFLFSATEFNLQKDALRVFPTQKLPKRKSNLSFFLNYYFNPKKSFLNYCR